ncbi:chaperonin family protein RbcX [Gloeomargarita lithophora Alchichica-D10]|uniref:RuBisCO chaperone RbcX n=1 Tax=Gloeomargarita lithophora Alchichica-D10 TaxID=1188229 RepID=A0A1J0A9L8_9CYAN|nr:chaperonin family protein RbcX [Gloeomargarita lithophora]APB32634.1 chaperonin family protein RbcX [Gloeomargarita lithophora Alchichica-D10]
MDYPHIARQTSRVLSSYLTYQAVRVVVAQLSQTDPPLAIWLNGFSVTGKIQDGERYLEELLRERQELALRVMTVREHLAENILDVLPEMVQAEIHQANTQQRKHHLERLTQVAPSELASWPELES